MNVVLQSRLDIEAHDHGRKENLPRCKIVSVLGAPGSGFKNYVRQAAEKMEALYFDQPELGVRQ